VGVAEHRQAVEELTCNLVYLRTVIIIKQGNM
jgi:hypothetical protein